MATHRSKALGRGPEPAPVMHVPDRLEATCPKCSTTSVYVLSRSGRPGTFIRVQGPIQFKCPNGHPWAEAE